MKGTTSGQTKRIIGLSPLLGTCSNRVGLIEASLTKGQEGDHRLAENLASCFRAASVSHEYLSVLRRHVTPGREAAAGGEAGHLPERGR